MCMRPVADLCQSWVLNPKGGIPVSVVPCEVPEGSLFPGPV